MQATYTKLRTGAWGVKLTGVVGSTVPANVTVTKRDGTAKAERIAEVLWRGDGAMICTIAAGAARASAYGGTGYRARGCKTGGNCSSFGSGKSCGADDCDGY